MVLGSVKGKRKLSKHRLKWPNTQHSGHMGQNIQNWKTIEKHLVRLTEVRGKVLSEKYAYKSVKTALLLSNVIDAEHQNSCLFTNKGHFSLPLWEIIGVLAKFYE